MSWSRGFLALRALGLGLADFLAWAALRPAHAAALVLFAFVFGAAIELAGAAAGLALARRDD